MISQEAGKHESHEEADDYNDWKNFLLISYEVSEMHFPSIINSLSRLMIYESSSIFSHFVFFSQEDGNTTVRAISTNDNVEEQE